MAIDEFVTRLRLLKPERELLLKRGFSEEYIDIVNKNYALSRKPSGTEDLSNNLMANLIIRYETKYLTFGYYAFSDKILCLDDQFVFCHGSDSILTYRTEHSEIIEYDTDEMSLLNRCGKNAESFLEALLNILEMKSLRLQGIIHANDNDVNERYFRSSVKNAGGDIYSNFFRRVIFG